MVLAQAYSDLSELRDKKWITVSCIDAWLLNMWKNMLNPRFRYLPTFTIPPVAQGDISDEEVDSFRTFFDLPDSREPCPQENVVYVLNTGNGPRQTGNHFCTVAFVPSMRVIYLMGRKYTQTNQCYDDKDWESWDGKRIWNRVLGLFGWDAEELGTMRLCSVNWKQNGHDCGPIACQVVQHLMIHGLRINQTLQWDRPNLPCCHALRRTMAQTINNLIVEGIEKFRSLGDPKIKEISHDNDEYNNWVGFMGTMTEAFQRDPASQLKGVVQSLDKAMMTCRGCQRMLDDIQQKECPIPVRRKNPEDVKKGRLTKLLKGARSMAQLVEEGREGEGRQDEEDEEEGEGEGKEGEGEGEGEDRKSVV